MANEQYKGKEAAGRTSGSPLPDTRDAATPGHSGGGARTTKLPERNLDVLRAMAGMVVASLAFAILMQSPVVDAVPGLWRLSMFTFGPCFISGVLAYYLLRRGRAATFPAW